MKRTYDHEKKPSQSTASVQPQATYLQTRGFAPLQTDLDENATFRPSGYTENFLEKLINQRSTNSSDTPVQRKPHSRLKAIAAQRMAIQAKLNIGEPNDKYEQEADATASKVVQQINSPTQDQSIQREESMEDEDEELQMKPISSIQREEAMEDEDEELQMKPISSIQREESMEEEDEELQMKSLVQRRENLGGGEASTDLESSIQSARGSGQSLDPNLQAKMGQAMGADFSGVKVHTDSQSDQLNKSIQAKAFTTGQDVFFRQDAYKPSSKDGQELIAHELTHVVQQSGGALQRSVGKPIGGQTLIQRYTIINPADYVLGVGSQFASQDVVTGGGTAKFVRNTREQTLGGIVDTQEEGSGAGAWNKTADKVPSVGALPQLKYGTDGTDAVGIESTTAESKVFYATPGVIAASNAKLKSLDADARLVDAGGSLDAPSDAAVLASPKLNLHMVKPGKTPDGQAPQVLEKFGQISECNSFIKYIIGDLTDRVAVFGPGQGSEAVVKEEKEPSQAIANFAVTQPGDGQALASHLTTTGTTSGTHDTALPTPYKTMVGKNARDQALGINSGAKAGVGEGYVITQGSPMPDSVTVRAWLDGFDKKLGGLALSTAENDMFKHKWGYHYAGVVATVGDDAVSLENYNRGTQLSWALDDLYNERIQAVAGFRHHLEALANAGETIPSVPALRIQWFTKLATDIAKLGDTANVDQIATQTALTQVASATKGMQIGASDLWHFKMYGSGGGQSFHEQWENSLDDPMTLRIRQSEDVSKNRYATIFSNVLNTLHAEKVSPAAALKIANIAFDDIPAIKSATTTKAIETLFRNTRTKVLDLGMTAMHDWAVEAAQLMDKQSKVVPSIPEDKTSGVAYSTTLDNLIQPWENKGWAVRKKSKQALTARRARLVELRRKIQVASAIRVEKP
jgi:Domain of unknown function (DUF4157)